MTAQPNRWPTREDQERHARQRGRADAGRGLSLSACPYTLLPMRRAWREAWLAERIRILRDGR